jgi:hypothetical protein
MATALKPGVTESTGSGGATAPRDDTDTQANRPDVPHKVYERMKARWKRCRDLMIGTDAIRAGAEDYLPRLVGEEDDHYAVRRDLCAVFNGFSRTVLACVGLLLQKPPELGEDMPPELVDLWEDVDAAGTHGNVFTRELVTNAIIDGHAGILVEYPRVSNAVQARADAVSQAAVNNPANVSADDERRAGLRPYWIEVRAENIIKALYAKVNGVVKLVLLSIREVSDERVGLFGVQTVVRYRVYLREGTRVTCQVWKTPVGGGVPTLEEPTIVLRNLREIPWSPLPAGQKISDEEDLPPLINLADLNIEHHQVKTEIRYLSMLACVPTIKRIGVIPTNDAEGEPVYPPINLGPGHTIEIPPGQGNDVGWISPDVTVLEPHKKNLEELKADMGASGLAFLAPDTRMAETAEAKRIDAAAQNATLTTLGTNTGDCLELAFQHTAAYMQTNSGSVTMNTDFESTVMDPAVMQAYGYLASLGKLSIETLLIELERGKRLKEGFDVQAEIRRILSESALPTDNAPPTNNDQPNNNTGA